MTDPIASRGKFGFGSLTIWLQEQHPTSTSLHLEHLGRRQEEEGVLDGGALSRGQSLPKEEEDGGMGEETQGAVGKEDEGSVESRGFLGG